MDLYAINHSVLFKVHTKAWVVPARDRWLADACMALARFAKLLDDLCLLITMCRHLDASAALLANRNAQYICLHGSCAQYA